MRKQYHSRVVDSDTLIWDVHRLVRLAKGITPHSVHLSEISELDENWWYKDPSILPTPRSISEHMKFVQETDLAHPIILCCEGRLMDGMHRAVKALLERRKTVDVVQFHSTPEPDFINVSLNDLPYQDESNE